MSSYEQIIINLKDDVIIKYCNPEIGINNKYDLENEWENPLNAKELGGFVYKINSTHKYFLYDFGIKGKLVSRVVDPPY